MLFLLTIILISLISELFCLTASEPVCVSEINLHNAVNQFDSFEMTCSVNFSGDWDPVMKWQQDGGPIITVGVVSNPVPYKSVTSSLTVLVTRNVIGSKFSCTTYFNEDNKPPSTSATNVPDYIYTWNSPEINVLANTSGYNKATTHSSG